MSHMRSQFNNLEIYIIKHQNKDLTTLELSLKIDYQKNIFVRYLIL